jgi:hypothetical protein
MKVKIYTNRLKEAIITEVNQKSTQEIVAYLTGNRDGWYATNKVIIRVNDIIHVENIEPEEN